MGQCERRGAETSLGLGRLQSRCLGLPLRKEWGYREEIDAQVGSVPWLASYGTVWVVSGGEGVAELEFWLRREQLHLKPNCVSELSKEIILLFAGHLLAGGVIVQPWTGGRRERSLTKE